MEEVAMHILPDDVLVIIFGEFCERNAESLQASASWVIFTVCKRGRALAISTPSLWTVFFFHAYSVDRTNIAPEATVVHLARVKEHTLDFRP